MHNKVSVFNYQKTNALGFLNITQKLFDKKVFDLYLTPFQLIILDFILSVKDINSKKEIWNSFLKGNLSLNVNMEDIDEDEEKDGIENKNDEIDQNNNNNDIPKDVTPQVSQPINRVISESISITPSITGSDIIMKDVTIKEDTTNDDNNNDDDISRVDLEDLKLQIDGYKFIGNLSLKVRYVLWQCALDLNFNSSDFSNQYCDDYVLLDNIIDPNENIDTDKPLESEILQPSITTEKKNESSDYDDDYDEDETPESQNNNNNTEDKNNNIPNSNTESENNNNNNFLFDESNRLVLDFNISKKTLQNLRTNDVEKIMENSHKMYHSFEHDRETMLKRLKLEKNDKLIESSKNKRSHEDIDDDDNENNNNNTESKNDIMIDNNETDNNNSTQKNNLNNNTNSNDNSKEEDGPHESKRPKKDTFQKSNVNLGAANLSLGHLLTAIHENKSKLKMSDYELKHLIIDVRKNRSKWASDDKVGQEELYEACEKVVLELRNSTEHSTPFLNKVSKREAPNYHQIIKKSMDLNTVLKKLKTIQYKCKQEFVDDIMLIWKNCLTYNSDPKHYLRAHAIAMQKKSLQLIPLIPDITIRDRSEVEKELEYMENDKSDKADEDVAGSGRKGLNMGAHKPVNASSSETEINNKENEDQSESTEISQVNKEDQDNSEPSSPVTTNNETLNDTTEEATTDQKSEEKQDLNKDDSKEDSKEDNINDNETEPSTTADVANVETTEGESAENKPDTKIDNIEVDEEGEDEDLDEELQEELEETTLFTDRDDDRDDIELSTWKTLTAQVRAKICMNRSSYFADGSLNKDAVAFLKNPDQMKTFQQQFKEFKEQTEQEQENKQFEEERIMKNGFASIIKQEFEPTLQLQEEPALTENNNLDKNTPDIDMDNKMYFKEYDVGNSLPILKYSGIDSIGLDKQEDEAVKNMLEHDENSDIQFGSVKKSGLGPKMNENIVLIQQIRHICHKISLIRLLQIPQSMQSSKALNQKAVLESHQFKPTNFESTFNLDKISTLPTRDYKNSKELMRNVMFKNISKIAMSNGFEATQPSTISILTDLSEVYLSNLIKTIKVHQESNSLNKNSNDEVLKMSLLENGIFRPDELYTYIESEFVKKTRRLRDVKAKLENFLKDLLRPTLKSLSEQNFEDESQSFMTGDFTSELTGEDFFGFRELGLEREFGVLSSSVPLQLLTFRFQSNSVDNTDQVKKIQPEEYHSIVYKKLAKDEIEGSPQLQLLKNLLEKALEKSNIYIQKNKKSFQGEGEEAEPEANPDLFLEDDEMLVKGKANSRPKIPPTGKISTNYKKRALIDAFILPEEEVAEEDSKANVDIENPNENMSSQMTDNSLNPSSLQLDSLHTPGNLDLDYMFEEPPSQVSDSFNLSLPRIDQ